MSMCVRAGMSHSRPAQAHLMKLFGKDPNERLMFRQVKYIRYDFKNAVRAASHC